jgi:CHAD domain-containing protein
MTFGKDMERMIKSFVRFQDCLGAFNDAQVAEESLRDLADSLRYGDKTSKEILLLLGCLIQIQRDIAESHRTDFLKMREKLPKQISRLQKILSKFSSSK